jgi:acyl-CoA synthetase (AMP-forming)/AMP-acid ligase II
MQGYASSRTDLERLDPPAALHTGDLAVRNAQDLYRITGRLKRILKLYGHRGALDQLEQALLTAGHEVICGGRDDRLVLAHRPGADAEAIRALALRACRIPHAALRCVALEDWPMTGAGKIAYHRLAELA